MADAPGVDPPEPAPGQRPMLRVGILLDEGDPPAWVARIIRDIQASDHAQIVAVIRCVGAPTVAPGGAAAHALRRLYDALDARAFTIAGDPFAPVEIAALLGDAARITVASPPGSGATGGAGAGPDGVATGELAAIHAQRLDVALQLGSWRLEGRARAVARFGVWAYQHGDARADLGGPAGFWEVMTHAPVTASALLARSEAGERILYQSWSATDPSSVRRNRANLYWKSSAFVVRALRDLHAHGSAVLPYTPGASGPPDAPGTSGTPGVPERASRADPTKRASRADPTERASRADPTERASRADPTERASRADRADSADRAHSADSANSADFAERAERAGPAGPTEPSTGRVLAGFARFGQAVVRARAERLLSRKQWLLAYGIDRRHTGAVPAQALADLTWIVPPRDRFWADPFVARHGNGWVVVFEEKLYAERNARIAALEIAHDGTLGEPYPVLERDYHLSYPFLFQWNAAWWMIPESARNGTIDLWRATEFPRRWTLERTLITGIHAVDATLIEHAGRWWMFCNIGEPFASKDDELHLFHAATPLGPWTPHPKNPIKSDVRGARPAGRPFWFEGAWHRPAQDSSAGYGSSIVVHRVERLDTTGYAEVEHARLAPSFAPGLIGLHTINAADGLTVIDLRVARARLPIFDRLRGDRRPG